MKWISNTFGKEYIFKFRKRICSNLRTFLSMIILSSFYRLDDSKPCHFNARWLRDPSKCVRCLENSRTPSVCHCSARDSLHFHCGLSVTKNDYAVLSVYGNRNSVGVSLLIGHSCTADVNLVLEDERSRLVVADVAVKSFKFQVYAVYTPNIVAESVFHFRRLAPVPNNPKRMV